MLAGVVCFTSAITQVGLTVAILVLVRYQLRGTSTVAVDGNLAFAETCYLSLPDDWPGACVYADVAACVSLAFSFAYFLLQFCAIVRASKATRSSKRVPWCLYAARVLVLVLNSVWWLAAACTLQYFAVRANKAGLAHSRQRAAVLACCWSSYGLFVLLIAGELIPFTLRQMAAACSLPLQQQQQCLPRPQELQLGLPVHLASSAAAGRGYTSAPGSFSAPAAAPRYGRQQQQHSIVLGVPCAPAVLVGSAHSMPQLPMPGQGPGAIQAVLLLQGAGSFAAGSGQVARVASLSAPLPAVWGAAAGGPSLNYTRGVAGRVLVVNRSF